MAYIIYDRGKILLCFRKFVDGEERFTILGVTSGSVTCGGGIPDFYTYLGQEEVD